MDRVFDDLIALQMKQTRRRWRAAVAAWAIDLAGDLTTGLAIGVGIAIAMAFA
ncbi:hypothetical protein [Mesorhizobium sp.]|uniref:hypothetical protein n=1 Tax=Mesorhizobium sp. TaxID=1871066 RepID=UPI0025E23882|nr:hypothetical protein [Mesorhizobium sp.]